MFRWHWLLTPAVLLGLIPWTSAESAPGAPRGWRAYPNPFSTRFRVEAPDELIFNSPEVQVRVFDMRGRMVRHWGYVLGAAAHEIVIDWDGRTDGGATAPSGWYIFDIRFSRFPPTWPYGTVRFKMLRIRGAPSGIYDWQSF